MSRDKPTKFTVAQAGVVDLLAAGLAAKEIAARLRVSTFTVKNHISEIRKRLRLSTGESLLAGIAADGHPVVGITDPEVFRKLTVRHVEVLRLAADGLTSKEIAESLGTSIHTIKNHIHAIMRALGVRSREEAARWLEERL